MPDAREIEQWRANAPSWTELTRAGYDVYRDLVNTPAFLELLPPVDGLRCLDIGCGEGHNTRLVAGLGASMVALDVVAGFVAAAAERGGPTIRHLVGDATALPFGAGAFDAVTAFMCLMDMKDPEAALAEAARVVRPGGFVQFSIVHPFTSTRVRHWVTGDDGERSALAVGEYFYEGPVTESFTFGSAPTEVRHHHTPFTVTHARRTLAGWLGAVLDLGLVIEALCEPRADAATAAAHPEVADTLIAPYFLIVRARKPATSSG